MYGTLCDQVCDDFIGIFVISYFDLPVHPKIDCSLGNVDINIEAARDMRRFTVRVDPAKDSVMVLKQKIYFVTGIPTCTLMLDMDDVYLSIDKSLLSQYKVKGGCTIRYSLRPLEFTQDTYKKEIVQSVKQSDRGIRILHHFLYYLRKNPVAEFNKITAAIRYITGNCTPLIHSLYEVKLNKSFSLLDAIALEEGFILLNDKILNEVFKQNTPKKNLLEYTLDVMGFILEIAASPKFTLQAQEKFETIASTCSISHTELVEPVRLSSSTGHIICNLTAVKKALQDGEIIPDVSYLSPASCVIDPVYLLVINRNLLEKKANITRWIGTYNPEKSIGLILSSVFSNKITWADASKFKLRHRHTKLVKASHLKTSQNCLTLNKNREIVINKGLGPKMPNKVELLNVLDGNIEEQDLNELALQTDQCIDFVEEVKVNAITRIPEEVLVVVFDTSGSMEHNFYGNTEVQGENHEQDTRINIARQLFNSFADRVIGYHVNMAVAVVLFNENITVGCDFTENILNFVNVIEACQLQNGSKLWDAIGESINQLIRIKASFPSAKQRILCLTDGRDHGSSKSPLEIIQTLQLNDITLDSVVIGKLSITLKSICLATGGCIFIPKTLETSLTLFESETFINSNLRAERKVFKIDSMADLSLLSSCEASGESPQILIPNQVHLEVVTLAAAFQSHNASSENHRQNPQLYTRILSELQYIMRNPNSAIAVFPCKDDITFWNVILNGPESSPYSSGVFLLYVRFSETYPSTAPQIRFVTHIYHCNINSTGRICHSIIDQFYSTDTRVKTILDCIYGLLLSPEPNDPLDTNVATMLTSNPEYYEYIAKTWTFYYASKPAEELLRGIEVQVSVKPEYIDAYTGNIMQDPVYVQDLGCNLDRSTVEFIANRPHEFPGIALERIFNNDQLKSEIQIYLAAIGK